MKKRLMRLALAAVLAGAMLCALGAAAPFDEAELFSGGGVTVTVTGYDPDGEWGPAFTVLIDNTAGQDMDLSLDMVSLDGVMCDPHWRETAPAGKVISSRVAWYDGDMAAAGVNYVGSVEAVLTVTPADGEAEPLFSGKVAWSAPAGDGTGPAVTEPDFGDFEPIPVAEGDLAVTAVGYDPAGDDGPVLILRVDNGTDRDLWVHMQNVSVDGEACAPYWSVTAAAGKTAYSACRWSWEELERCGLDGLGRIEFTLESVDWASLDTLDKIDAELALPGAPAAPAATAAPAETETDRERYAAMGAVKAGRYENSWFDLAFEPGEDWHFMTEEELRTMMDLSSRLTEGTDAEGIMEQIDGGFAAAAATLDGRQSVNILVQHVPGLEDYVAGGDLMDAVLAGADVDEDGGVTLPGMGDATVQRNTVTLAGREVPGLLVETSGSVLRFNMAIRQQQVYLARGDWFMQLSLTSLRDDDGLDEIAALFTALDS